MLEQLFGSKTRVALLRTFLHNPDNFFYVRELVRSLDMHLNSIRRELENLEAIGIIQASTKVDFEREVEKEIKDNKKYYKLNSDFIFSEELRALLVKAQLVIEQSLIQRIEKLGDVAYCLLSGVFVGRVDSQVDIMIVGDVKKPRFRKLVESFERDLGRPINYAILTEEDFRYRKDVADRFLYDLMENKHLLVIDHLFNQANYQQLVEQLAPELKVKPVKVAKTLRQVSLRQASLRQAQGKQGKQAQGKKAKIKKVTITLRQASLRQAQSKKKSTKRKNDRHSRKR